MAVQARPRQIVEPPGGVVLHRIRRYLVEHRIGNADLGQHGFAAMNASRQQQVARLFAKERDRHRRSRRCTADVAGPAVDAARHVDRDNGNPARVECLDDRLRRPFDRPRQPGAKDRVDDQLSAVEHRRRQRLDRPTPTRRRLAGIAAQGLDVAKQRQPHLPAAFGQDARRDKTVAAIVARPAQHRDRSRRPPPRHRIGDGQAGLFHQRAAGDAAGDRQPIGLGHLLRCQERLFAPAFRGDRHRRNVSSGAKKPNLDAPS